MVEKQKDAPAGKVAKGEAEWRKQLTPTQYHVCREKGTEQAFTGEYWDSKQAGLFRCVCCGQELFDSDTKFESHSGWPSFWQPLAADRVQTEADVSLGMVRTEVTCSRCDAHLGHVFDDGPKPSGLRYCLNSAALQLEERGGKD
ncbi:MAG: peptide-methionine (R)-S-oxide reductase MsrB [SAR324 cluster bacterium]|nr:peptide-methionine (R)-S-oxide reductase MsrB [SAR324 cluster bacterium]